MKAPKVVLPLDTSDAYGRGIVLGISKYCHQHGPWRLNQKLPYYFDSKGHSFDPDRPENWMADGVIMDTGNTGNRIPEMLRQKRIPVILCDCYQPIHDMPELTTDSRAIAEMAFDHFRDRNYTQLAYCGFDGMYWVSTRGAYFANCARAKGINVAHYEVKGTAEGFLWDDVVASIEAWLNTLPRPLGLLACNDDCAQLVIAACQAASIDVPGDIAVLGIDNDEVICLPGDPPISSIALDFEKGGFEAAALLDRLMKGEEEPANQRILIEPTYVNIRRSTDTFAVSDPAVKAALAYISEHSHKKIRVPDVVRATWLSRRPLECRFKAALGQSINKVIRTQRVTKAANMLIETNFSISNIAVKLGFTSIEHISRYFSSEKGMSPSEFRKKFAKE